MTRTVPPPTRGPLVRDLLAVGAVAALVLVAAFVGWGFIRAGQDLILGFPPLLATWAPHVGPGTPVAMVIAGFVIAQGAALAHRLAWRPLLALSWVVAAGWTWCWHSSTGASGAWSSGSPATRSTCSTSRG